MLSWRNFQIVTVADAPLQEQCDLLAWAVDAFDEDTFHVCGFRRAGGPDDVWALAESSDGIRDGAMDFRFFQNGYVDPR